MSVAKKVAINTGFLYARMVITVFISLYATRLALSALGAKSFGIFNLVGGAIAMLGFLNASMTAATQRFMSYAQGAGDLLQLKRIFSVSMVLHLLIGVIMVVVLEVAGYFFFNGVLNIAPDRIYAAKVVYQCMVASTFFTIIAVPYDAVINAHENMFFFAVLGIVESVIKLLIGLYLTVAAGDALIIYGVLTAVLTIVLLQVRLLHCSRRYEECALSIRRCYDRSVMKQMTTFAGWSLLGSATSMGANYGQGIVVNIFFGTVVNAAQGISSQVSGQLGAFAVTMLRALNPVIAKSEGSGDRSLMLKATMMGSKVSFFLLILFYVPVFIEMPFIFHLWLKDVPEYTVIFCRLLLIRNLVQQLFVTITSSISAVGNIKKFSIYTSVFNMVPLILSYILFTFHFPAFTIYVVFLLYSIINSIYILYFASNNLHLSIPMFLREVVFRCVFSLICILVVSSIPLLFLNDGYLRLAITCILSLVFFVTFSWIIGLTSNEKSQLKGAINSFLVKARFARITHKFSKLLQ